MPTYRRVKAGRLAKAVGEQFENFIISRSRANNITCVRIPDGCKHVRGPKGYSLKRVPTPFDYVLLKNTKAVIIDAKTVDSEVFKYSSIIHHQMMSLYQCSKDALASGYLVWHRPIDRVIFYHVDLLRSLKQRTSLNRMHGLDIGPVLMMDLGRIFKNYESALLDSSAVSAEII